MPNNWAEFSVARMPASVRRHEEGFVKANTLLAKELARVQIRDWIPDLEAGKVNLSLALALALTAAGGGIGIAALLHSLPQPENSAGDEPGGDALGGGAYLTAADCAAGFNPQGTVHGEVRVLERTADCFHIQGEGINLGWITNRDFDQNQAADELPPVGYDEEEQSGVGGMATQPPTGTPRGRGWSRDATKSFAPAEFTDQPVLKPTDATPSFGIAGAVATRQRTATPTAEELQPAGQSLIEMEFLSCSGDWDECFAEITARLQPILERSDLKWEKVQKFVMNRLHCGPDPSYPSIPLSHEGWQIYGRFPFNFIGYDGTNVVGDIWALFGLDDSGEKVVQPAIALEGGEIDEKKQGWIGLVGGTYASGEDPFNQGAGQMDVDQVLRDVNIGEKIIVRFTRNEDCGDGDLAQFIAVNYQSGDKTGSIQPLLQLGGLYYQKP